jgi:hypothetical protein
MQNLLIVHSFKLERSGVQQESIVVGGVKYHTVGRRMELCHHLRQMSTEQDMSLHISHMQSQDGWCRRHKN